MLIYSKCYVHNMALREVQPLENDEWIQLVAELKTQPDSEKIAYIQKAVKSGRKLKVHR